MGFQPQYIKEVELGFFGLPNPTEMPDIITSVKRASSLIDEHCGRNTEGNKGSIVYSTYTETLTIRPGQKNCVRLSYRPLVVLPTTTQDLIVASGVEFAANDPLGDQPYDTGFTPNELFLSDNVTATPLISISGLYAANDDFGSLQWSVPFVLGISTPGWTTISVPDTQFDAKTGDIWLPPIGYSYSKVTVRYNAGFDPFNIPNAVKFATASTVRNLLAKGNSTTGLKGYSGAGKMSLNFTDELIDGNIDLWLRNYKVVVAR